MRIHDRVVAVALLGSSCALAAPKEPARPSAQVPEEYETEAPLPAFVPTLARPPGPAIALEGYAGLALLVGRGDTRSRSVVGGLLRGRYRYFMLGGAVEVSDSGQADALHEETEEAWRAYQVFAGAWLPFDRWVDMDASVGYAVRGYSNPDPIYGPNGFDVSGSALTWRFGISDRSGEGRFGARLGAAILGTVDFTAFSLPFERRYLRADGTIGVTRGTTDVGGVSFALVVTGGFELGGAAR